MYIIEGNIGAGKSTFLKLLQQRIPALSIALEPVENWQNSDGGQSLLANFYQDPRRWAYTFETLTLMSRVREMQQQYGHTANQLVERSIYSGYYCFAKNGYEQGFMAEVEWQVYSQWFDFLVRNAGMMPTGFIYLRISPEVAFERIKKRNRNAETGISLEYLQQIHEKHERFLVQKKDALPHVHKVSVLILECDQDFETNSELLEQHCHAVQMFLQKTQPTFKPAVIDEMLLRENLFASHVETIQE